MRNQINCNRLLYCGFLWHSKKKQVNTTAIISGISGGYITKEASHSPRVSKSMARWKPHNGQLIPKHCLYTQGSKYISTNIDLIYHKPARIPRIPPAAPIIRITIT